MLDRVVPDSPGQSLEVVCFDWSAVNGDIAENLANQCCCHLADTSARPVLQVAVIQTLVFLPAPLDWLYRVRTRGALGFP